MLLSGNLAFPAKDKTLIELDAVEKTFTVRGKTIRALSASSLQVEAGEFIGLVGPSGCGKSTVLNMVSGTMAPSQGTILYEGTSLTGPNLEVGYMTQKDTLLPWRTLADNIGISLELKCRSLDKSEIRERVSHMIDLVGLRGFESHYPAELSGGMRKRVALARLLIYEPRTLLMDEPFGALDAQLKLLMLHELQRLTQQRNMTVLFVTHDLEEAITLCDRIVVFKGRPGAVHEIREVPFDRPRDVFRIRFTNDFAALHEELWDLLQDEVVARPSPHATGEQPH